MFSIYDRQLIVTIFLGTGKTFTVYGCISQILVGAPSNSAADLILERLLVSGRLKSGDIICLVSFDDGKSHNMTTTDDGLRLRVGKSLIPN